MATVDDAVTFLKELVLGIPEGQLSSLVLAGLVVLAVLRIVLPKQAFGLLVQIMILGTMVGATWLGYGYANDPAKGFDAWVPWAVLGVGIVASLLVLTAMASNRQRTPVVTSQGQQPIKGRAVETMDPLAGQRPTGGAGPAAVPGPAQGGLLAQFGRIDPTQQQNIFAVIAFMFIAEFGVFSSVTITAQSAPIGLGFFVLFHIAAVLYIWTSYQEPKRGLRHYLVVAIASVGVALLLYYTWTPSDEVVSITALFPWNFFTEPTMVASVTGVAFSLIISGKG